MAKPMHLLQSLSYYWARKGDFRSLFSAMHSTTLGCSVLEVIKAAIERRSLLSSSTIIPVRAG